MSVSWSVPSPPLCQPPSAALHTSCSGSGPFSPENGHSLMRGSRCRALWKTCKGFQADTGCSSSLNSPLLSVVTSSRGWSHSASPRSACCHGDAGSSLPVDGGSRLWTQHAAEHPWRPEEALSDSWCLRSEKSAPWGNKAQLMVPSNHGLRKSMGINDVFL